MIRVDKGRLAALLLVFSGSSVADSLSCAAESASGFVYDEQSGTWQVSSFPVDNRKYLIQPANEDDIVARALKYDYEVKDAVSSKPVIHCKSIKLPDSNQETGLILCRGSLGASFNIDRESGRYVRSQPSGFVTRQASTAATDGPYMEIGICSAN